MYVPIADDDFFNLMMLSYETLIEICNEIQFMSLITCVVLASPPKEMEQMSRVASRHAKSLSQFWDAWLRAAFKARYPKPNIAYILELQSHITSLLNS